MISKVKLVMGGVIGVVILAVLFFIPTSEFGINSYSPESPPPVYVASNYYDEFEITPSQCTTESETVNFDFTIKSNLDEDYRLEVHLVLIDKNEMDLSREAILVELSSGETKTVTHQTPFNLDMETCGIELRDAERANLPFIDAASSYMEGIVPTIDDFKDAISETQDIDEIFSKFGRPHDDIGSGIHIYVYDLNDKTQIWIGYVEDIWYVQQVDSAGNLIEELFVKNKKNPENCPSSFNSRCFTAKVTEVVDGNTIQINGGKVRLAFLPAPNLDEEGGREAKKFIEVLCPVGSDVLFDQDDLQPLDRYYDGVGIMGTPLGVIYCNGLNINEELIKSEYGQISEWFCDHSEFSNREWAKKNGC